MNQSEMAGFSLFFGRFLQDWCKGYSKFTPCPFSISAFAAALHKMLCILLSFTGQIVHHCVAVVLHLADFGVDVEALRGGI